MCVYIHMFCTVETLVVENNYKKTGTAVNAASQGNLPACQRFASLELRPPGAAVAWPENALVSDITRKGVSVHATNVYGGHEI